MESLTIEETETEKPQTSSKVTRTPRRGRRSFNLTGSLPDGESLVVDADDETVVSKSTVGRERSRSRPRPRRCENKKDEEVPNGDDEDYEEVDDELLERAKEEAKRQMMDSNFAGGPVRVRVAVRKKGRVRGSASPARSRGSASPARSRVDANPARSRGSASPARSRGGASPARSRGSASPARSRVDASPARIRGSSSLETNKKDDTEC